jgi:uncharacterized membrane protein YqjE
MIENNQHACDARPGRHMRQSVSQLGSNVVSLVELQAELLQMDLREWTGGIVRSVIALTIAAVLLLASMPILLFSLGYFLNSTTDLPMAACMLIAAGVGVLAAAICAGVGWWLFKRDQGLLHRFRSELRRNVRWLKQVLTAQPSPFTEASQGR